MLVTFRICNELKPIDMGAGYEYFVLYTKKLLLHNMGVLF